jgi:glycosyltransferase involved in cell wall biosynthesis
MTANFSHSPLATVCYCTKQNGKTEPKDNMRILSIIPYARYYSNFSEHLAQYFSDVEHQPPIAFRTISPPYYSLWAKNDKFLHKRQVLTVMLLNFLYFSYYFLIKKRAKQDVIILAGHIVAIPYLLLCRIVPLLKPRKRFIIVSFFLHRMGEKKVIQKLLRFLLNNPQVTLVVQSPYEIKFYSQLMEKGQIVHYPFCQHEVSYSEGCGRGGDYIFAGGYSNRDYQCLFQAAQEVNHDFVIICSRLNKMGHLSWPENVTVLSDTTHADFHGYMKNARIIVIPLKDETGSSGQMVALAAMCMAKPIIYTGIDSVSQYFENGVSGISCQRGNASELAEKIRHLLSHPEFCEELASNAFAAYRDRFHIRCFCQYVARIALA